MCVYCSFKIDFEIVEQYSIVLARYIFETAGYIYLKEQFILYLLSIV